MLRSLAAASALLFISLILAGWRETHHSKPMELTPTLTGQPEYCLTCHNELAEISPSHPIKTFGCVVCHGGERLALDANLAHSSMRGGQNPSDLSVVEQSCGGDNCHSGSPLTGQDHIQRVKTSVQSTYAGAIANIRYTFGAQPDLKARFGISTITDNQITSLTGTTALETFDPSKETNPFIQKFADNCLICHLNAQPPGCEQYSHLAGCAACHTPDINSFTKGQIHHLTIAIPYKQCNTCHNRGNYDLRSMSFIERNDQPTDRIHDYYQPIAQFTRCEYTLDCVDCHTRNEIMGDGDIHNNKKEIQYVQCKTCHGTPTELPMTKILTDEDDVVFRLVLLNPIVDLKVGEKILITEKGEPLWNTRALSDGTYELIGKASSQRFIFHAVAGSKCTQDPADQSSAACQKCHSVQR